MYRWYKTDLRTRYDATSDVIRTIRLTVKACKGGGGVTDILQYCCWVDSEPVIKKMRCWIVGCPLLNTNTNITIHVLHNLKIKTDIKGGGLQGEAMHILL